MEPTIEQPAEVERPIQATRAIQLLISSLVIGFIASAARLVGLISGTALVFALLILLAFLAIYFYLITKIAAGRNWARIIFLVLVLLGTPFAIPAYIAEARRNILPGTLSIIMVALQLIATYLLFTKNSNLWFRKSV